MTLDALAERALEGWLATMLAASLVPLLVAVYCRLRRGAPASERAAACAAGVAAIALAAPAAWSGGLMGQRASLPSLASHEVAVVAAGPRVFAPVKAVRAPRQGGVPLPPEAIRAAAGVWLVGLVWGVASLGRRLAQVRQLKAQRRAPEGPEAAEVAAWADSLPPGRRFEFGLADGLPGPLAVGWLRPSVIAPAKWERRLSRGDRRRLYLHEAAHLRRADDWTQLLEAATAALIVFHPGWVWLRRRLDLEREAAVDAWVVERDGAPLAYARTLAAAAEFSLGTRLAAGLGAASQPSQLRRRIEMLLRDPQSRCSRRAPVWPAAVAAVGASLLAAACANVSAQQAPEPPPPPPARAVPAAPATPAIPAAPASPQRPAAPPAPPAPPAARPSPVPQPSPQAANEMREVAEQMRRVVESMRPRHEELREASRQIQRIVETSVMPRQREIAAQAAEIARAQLEGLPVEDIERKIQVAEEQIRQAERQIRDVEVEVRAAEQSLRPSEAELRRLEERMRNIEVRIEAEVQEALEAMPQPAPNPNPAPHPDPNPRRER